MKKLLQILIVFSLLIPSIALADGYILEDGNYKIKVDGLPNEVQVGETLSLSFLMLNNDGATMKKVDGWVRVVQDDRTIFESTDFSVENGEIDFGLTIFDPGEYDMITRLIYRPTGEEATVTFPIKVAGEKIVIDAQDDKDKINGKGLALITLIIGLAAGLFFGYMMPRKKRLPDID